jgi:hypothetical protein
MNYYDETTTIHILSIILVIPFAIQFLVFIFMRIVRVKK